MRVAREDRTAAPQMKRLERLQAGLLESWDLLPEGCRPLMDEDIFTIVGEVEGATRLARRRAALRRLLESVHQREISRRIEGLEKDFSEPEKSSPLWASFESALEGRRGELASCKGSLDGISMINAQLEGAESLLFQPARGVARSRQQSLAELSGAGLNRAQEQSSPIPPEHG